MQNKAALGLTNDDELVSVLVNKESRDRGRERLERSRVVFQIDVRARC